MERFRPVRRSISARRFNFCRPTRRRAAVPFCRIQFRVRVPLEPFSSSPTSVPLSLHRLPYAIHIADARAGSRRFRSGDGLTLPIENYRAVYGLPYTFLSEARASGERRRRGVIYGRPVSFRLPCSLSRSLSFSPKKRLSKWMS